MRFEIACRSGCALKGIMLKVIIKCYFTVLVWYFTSTAYIKLIALGTLHQFALSRIVRKLGACKLSVVLSHRTLSFLAFKWLYECCAVFKNLLRYCRAVENAWEVSFLLLWTRSPSGMMPKVLYRFHYHTACISNTWRKRRRFSRLCMIRSW